MSESSAERGQRLTSDEYWSQRPLGSAPSPGKQDMPWWRAGTGRYSEYLGNHLCDRYLPVGSHLRFLEVGAAPGRNLIKFHQRYRWEPFGVEYLSSGIEVMRDLLTRFGISPDHAIHADFFDPTFQERFRESFDVVASFGFLEHFSDPREVVEKHLNVLRQGGYLLVTIPNFRRVNYYLKAFFNRDFIATHNLALMDLDMFRRCFAFEHFTLLECRYSGGFRFPEPSLTKPWKRIAEKLMGKLQLLHNALLMPVFGAHYPESKYFSAALVCLGKKTSTGDSGEGPSA